MSYIIEGTTENFEECAVNAGMPVLLDFTSPSCGPCRALLPVLEDVATTFAGRARIVKIEVEEQPELAERFKVLALPALIVLADGEERERLSSGVTRSQLANRFERILAGRA